MESFWLSSGYSRDAPNVGEVWLSCRACREDPYSTSSVFPFEQVDGFDPNCVRNPTEPHDLGSIKQFMAEENPFCLIIALTEPHVPWVMGDASKYPTKKMKLPPNIADTPRTREDFSRYLAEITYMDEQVGEILRTLQETQKEKILWFSSARNRALNFRVVSGPPGIRVCTLH